MNSKLSLVNAKILVVEDDAEFTSVLEHSLKQLNTQFTVYGTPTAEDAIACLKKTHFDLVILDYTLEGNANGLVVWDYCRKQLPDVPVLMVSGLPVVEFLKIMAGYQKLPKFLTKPFLSRDFQGAIQGLLEAGSQKEFHIHAKKAA